MDGVSEEIWFVLEEWYTNEERQLLAEALAPIGIVDGLGACMVPELGVGSVNGQTCKRISNMFGRRAGVERELRDLGGS